MDNKRLKEAQELLLIAQVESILGRPAVTGEEPDLVGPNGTIYGNAVKLRGRDLSTDPTARGRQLDMYAGGYAKVTGLPVEEVKRRILAHALPEERLPEYTRRNKFSGQEICPPRNFENRFPSTRSQLRRGNR
jgi:hypothetical protein